MSVTETMHPAEFILSEAPNSLSREPVTVKSGQTLKSGHVIAKATGGRTASTAFAGTGNGTITMDATTPVHSNAKLGAYTATCIAAATNSGTFLVEDPDGINIGQVVVGATFNDKIKFVIADGGTDFVLGDKFTITVVLGTEKVIELVLAGTDGTQVPYGILYEAVDAAAADKPGAAVVRQAEVQEWALTYPSGATTAQKNLIKEHLARVGLIIRA